MHRRLLHLLETNPEEGLRFALPLAGDGSRGLAEPGARLPPRDVNFSLRGLGGGRPGDPWVVSWQTRQKLIERYRELANREIRLGRFRRAAYIYAQLLGDFAAAAAALIQGRHYREAAVLYRDRLHRPLEAARCLKEGGLLLEATAIYQAEGEFETAGDLYARLDRPQEAEQAYRRAANKLCVAGDLLAAAHLLEEKVRADDEALTLLSAAWPDSRQAPQCLHAKFDLLARLGRHEQAEHEVAAFRQAATPAPRVAALTRVLSALARAYPDHRLRHTAADTARVLAGQRLPQADRGEQEELVRAVTSLAPEDRLLTRDGHRWSDRKRWPTAPPAPRPRGHEPVLVRSFFSPPGIRWQAATAAGDVFHAVGRDVAGLAAVECAWDGSLHMVRWNVAWTESAIVVAAGASASHGVIVHSPFGPRLKPQPFAGSRGEHPPGWVGSPPWLPDAALGVAYSDSGLAWSVCADQGGLVLYGHENGVLVTTQHVPLSDFNPAILGPLVGTRPQPLVARRDTVFLAVGSQLVRVMTGNRRETLEMPDQVLALTASAPHTRTRIAATFEDGGAVVWTGLEFGEMHAFSEGLNHPVAAFTRGGLLVSVTQDRGEIYRTDNQRLLLIAEFSIRRIQPISVLPLPAANEFATLAEDGAVRVYRVPGV